MRKRFGCDFGGVTADRKNGGKPPSFFYGDHRKAPEIEGALRSLTLLSQRFDGERHIITKAEQAFKTKTLEWCSSNHFHLRTGIPPEQIHFGKTTEEKIGICLALAPTHYMDDRLARLMPLIGFVPHLYWFGQGHEDDPLCDLHVLKHITIVHDWHEALPRLLHD